MTVQPFYWMWFITNFGLKKKIVRRCHLIYKLKLKENDKYFCSKWRYEIASAILNVVCGGLWSMINSHKINRISRSIFEKVWRMTELLMLAQAWWESEPGPGVEVKIVSLITRAGLTELIKFDQAGCVCHF